jgi:hypothetical protein
VGVAGAKPKVRSENALFFEGVLGLHPSRPLLPALALVGLARQPHGVFPEALVVLHLFPSVANHRTITSPCTRVTCALACLPEAPSVVGRRIDPHAGKQLFAARQRVPFGPSRSSKTFGE